MDNMKDMDKMSKAEAIGILARMAAKRTTTAEETTALQVALRSTMKRHFDRMRNLKRRDEARARKESAE